MRTPVPTGKKKSAALSGPHSRFPSHLSSLFIRTVVDLGCAGQAFSRTNAGLWVQTSRFRVSYCDAFARPLRRSTSERTCSSAHRFNGQDEARGALVTIRSTHNCNRRDGAERHVVQYNQDSCFVDQPACRCAVRPRHRRNADPAATADAHLHRWAPCTRSTCFAKTRRRCSP